MSHRGWVAVNGERIKLLAARIEISSEDRQQNYLSQRRRDAEGLAQDATSLRFGVSARISDSIVPGTILDNKLLIACGEGALRPTLLQRAGKGAMSAEELLRGFAIPKGTNLT